MIKLLPRITNIYQLLSILLIFQKKFNYIEKIEFELKNKIVLLEISLTFIYICKLKFQVINKSGKRKNVFTIIKNSL